MPTHDELARFLRDYDGLNDARKDLFDVALAKFIADLKEGRDRFRPGLRVKGVQGHPGVYEMTRAPDGRATFEYGDPVRDNDAHIIRRRCGTHDIFDKP